MERIREALQRARQERGPERGFGDGRSRPAASADDAQADKIAYTSTRVVEIPRETMAARRIVTGYAPCIFTDAFRVLATQVSHKLRANGWNTLAVTSPNEHEGKTLVAINLAICLAAQFHQTALLVDADLRRCRVREALGLGPGRGLSDHLLSQAPIEQLLINPGIAGFVVLPGGEPLLTSSELLGSRQMAELVKELKDRYRSRIVVFDLPPLLAGADVLAFAPHVEAALLVVEEGRTRSEDVTRGAELLSGAHLIGTVLNKSSAASVSADRPYTYSYSYGRTL